MRALADPGRFFVRLASKRPEQAAEAVAYLASSPHLEGFTGRFFKGTQPSESNAYSRDSKVQKRLWREGDRPLGEWFPRPRFQRRKASAADPPPLPEAALRVPPAGGPTDFYPTART